MHHLILGYGYCGYFLAQELIKQGEEEITVLSRHANKEYFLPQVMHQIQDSTQAFSWTKEDTTLYYLIPPPAQEEKDTLLEQVLKNPIKVKKVVYFGSSGVYGNHQGQLVNEEALCSMQHPRQLSRLDAEQQWIEYSQHHNTELSLLRIGGIFGPQRLPIEAAKKQTALIEPQQAPLINYIYVRDLARIASLLPRIERPYQLWNIADGCPQTMGTLQLLVAKQLNLPPAPYESWDLAWQKASAMKKEFMASSKCLDIHRLRSHLPPSFSFTPLEEAIQQSLSS